MTRWLGLVAVLALVFGCAHGPPRLRGQLIKKEVAVLVTVSDEAAHTDELGGTASIVEAITEGLDERGVPNQIFAADGDHPPAPRIEVHVEKWDLGDRSERAGLNAVVGVIGAAATAGGYLVSCAVYREGDKDPAYRHTYSGLILGTSEDASVSEGRSVGRSILAGALGDGRSPARSAHAPP